jgi:hypothetical protein
MAGGHVMFAGRSITWPHVLLVLGKPCEKSRYAVLRGCVPFGLAVPTAGRGVIDEPLLDGEVEFLQTRPGRGGQLPTVWSNLARMS